MKNIIIKQSKNCSNDHFNTMFGYVDVCFFVLSFLICSIWVKPAETIGYEYNTIVWCRGKAKNTM